MLKVDELIANKLYKVISRSSMEILKLRKGFYCFLCDARTHTFINEHYHDVKYMKEISLSEKFCKKLVDRTITASYYKIRYLKEYLGTLSNLISCTSGNFTTFNYDMSIDQINNIRNCFLFKNKFFFFFCSKYCEEFHITKYSQIFDGNIKSLKNIFGHLSTYR